MTRLDLLVAATGLCLGLGVADAAESGRWGWAVLFAVLVLTLSASHARSRIRW